MPKIADELPVEIPTARAETREELVDVLKGSADRKKNGKYAFEDHPVLAETLKVAAADWRALSKCLDAVPLEIGDWPLRLAETLPLDVDLEQVWPAVTVWLSKPLEQGRTPEEQAKEIDASARTPEQKAAAHRHLQWEVTTKVWEEVAKAAEGTDKAAEMAQWASFARLKTDAKKAEAAWAINAEAPLISPEVRNPRAR